MKSISGFWAGVYAYPNDPAPSVNFDCELRVDGSVVTGQITESHAPGQMLLANISGQIAGTEISFIKSYQTTQSNFLLEIAYSGQVGPKKDHISGHWRAGMRTGTFEMHRDAGDIRAAKTRQREKDPELS